jgi:hypothetical protein
LKTTTRTALFHEEKKKIERERKGQKGRERESERKKKEGVETRERILCKVEEC